MRAIPPLTISAAKLTSSTVVETPPAAYSGITTYAAGDLAYVGTVGQALEVYESLQNANTGHTPASSPTWWKDRGAVYAEYSGGVTYALGDTVQVTSTHSVYQSLIAGNTGNAVTDTTKWQYMGPTNKWAMFDTLRNTQATVPLTMTVVITPGERINSLFLGGMVANQAEITVTSVTGGGTVYHVVEDLNTRDVTDLYRYFFEPFSTRASLVIWDIPPYTDAVITVTLTATSGNVSCGALILGTFEECGTVLVGAQPGSLNFSRITRDAYGNATLIPVKGKPLLICSTQLEPALLSRITNLKKATDAVPAVWAGLTDDTNPLFDSMVILGVWKKFDPVANEAGASVTVNFELEEL